MKIMTDSIIPPFKSLITERPWGHYGLYSDNEICTSKILYIKKNELLSMQYHFKRDQFYLILDDNFIIEYSDKQISPYILNEPNEDIRFAEVEKFLTESMISEKANEGDMFGFSRRVVHRAKYWGEREYGRVLDIAFGENDEEDVTRLDDKYGRISTKK